MGYAGYAPGKYAPPKPTEAQAALRQVARQDSYELLSKLLRNVVRCRPLACRAAFQRGRVCRHHIYVAASHLCCTGPVLPRGRICLLSVLLCPTTAR